MTRNSARNRIETIHCLSVGKIKLHLRKTDECYQHSDSAYSANNHLTGSSVVENRNSRVVSRSRNSTIDALINAAGPKLGSGNIRRRFKYETKTDALNRLVTLVVIARSRTISARLIMSSVAHAYTS